MAMCLTLLISAIQWKKRSRGRGRGRVRRRRKVEIPLDLQIEILSRLPAKSLMRFKCVSKLWSCLIRSRYFSNLYLTVAAASPLKPPRLYMSLVEHTECDSMEVCHNPGKSLLLSLSSSSSSSSLEPDLSLTIQGIGGHRMVILRGLMLYSVCRKACIYNPTTRQSVTLPAVKSIIFAQEESREKFVYYFLGHDSVLDQYKVVCIVVTFSEEESGNFESLSSEHWVFTLEKPRGCWKKIEFDQPPPHVPTSQGLCINGVIYYLASTRTSYEIVISFDVRSEEFNMIQSPQLGLAVGFIEYGGKPTIVDHTYLRYGLVDLWVLEDGGRWSKRPLVLQPCQMHLLYHDDIVEYVVEYITQNNEVVLVPRPMPTPAYFLYYHLQNNDLRKVNVTFLSPVGFYWDFKQMDKSENIMHLET